MGLKRRTKRHHNNTPICFAHLSGCSTNHLGVRVRVRVRVRVMGTGLGFGFGFGLGLGFGFGLGLGLGPRSRSRRHGTGEGRGGQAVGGGGMTRGAEGGAWVQGWGARAGRAARACGVPAAVPRAGETPQQAICRSKGAERVKGR